jgi:hypothetical protein
MPEVLPFNDLEGVMTTIDLVKYSALARANGWNYHRDPAAHPLPSI